MDLFRYPGVTGMQELTRNPLKPAESCMAARGISCFWVQQGAVLVRL